MSTSDIQQRSDSLTAARAFQRESSHESAFRTALELANEVIGFDAHRIYSKFGDDSEIVWHVPTGYMGPEELEARSDSVYECQKRLDDADKPTVRYHDLTTNCWVLVHRLHVEGWAEGYLAIYRTQLGEFSEIEQDHLRAVTHLLEMTLREECDILERVQLAFLDQRVLLRHLDRDDFLDVYLRKVLDVCHRLSHDLSVDSSPSLPTEVQGKVRIAVHLLTENEMALQLVRGLTACSQEIRLDAPNHLTHLQEGAETPNSLLVQAYDSRQTVLAKNRNGIFAPVITDNNRRLGVLAIKSTESNAYQPEHCDALTLLAAHLSWPLQQSITQFAAEQKLERFMRCLEGIRHETNPQIFWSSCEETLEELGYTRGFRCKVDYRNRRLVGLCSWGGDQTKRQMERSRFHLDEDRKAPQVKAVLSKECQVFVSTPKKFPRTEEEDRTPSYAVFPLANAHGRVLWTVQVERADRVAFGRADLDLIRSLAQQTMKVQQEIRFAQLERACLETMLENNFPNLGELLMWFADFAVEKGISVRCRVFLIDEGKQIPFYEGGDQKTPGFPKARLGKGDNHILRAVQPTLFYRKGYEKPPLNQSEEFAIKRGVVDRHLKSLDNKKRSQWVETPIRLAKEIVAKLVFDHNPTPEAPDDAFTLDEMHLISRLTRTLNLAAKSIEKGVTNAQLKITEVVADLLNKGPYSRREPEVDPPPHHQPIFRGLVWGKDWLREPHSLSLPGEIGRTVSLAEELDFFAIMLRSAFGADRQTGPAIELQPPEDNWDLRVPEIGRPLSSICLAMVQYLFGASKSNDKILVRPEEDFDRYRICVWRQGRPLPPTKAHKLGEIVRHLGSYTEERTHDVVVLAAILARSYGWRVELLTSPQGDRLQLIVPKPSDRRSRDMKEPDLIGMLVDPSRLSGDWHEDSEWTGKGTTHVDFANLQEGWKWLKRSSKPNLETMAFLIVDLREMEEIVEGQSNFVEGWKDRYPLSKILLLGPQRNLSEADLQNYCGKHLIEYHPFEETVSYKELVEKMKIWRSRSSDPFLQEFRAYIKEEGQRALDRVYPDGFGGFQSVVDQYQEILLETEFGEDLEKVWKTILDDRPEWASTS